MRNGRDIVQDWRRSAAGQVFDWGELVSAIDYAIQTQESGRESARKLIAKWRTEAKEDHKHGDWDLAKEKERCADELEAALGESATESASVTDVGAGPVKPSDASRICSTEREPNVHETGAGASATDSASLRGASNCLKVPLRMGSADVSASTPETGAAAMQRDGEEQTFESWWVQWFGRAVPDFEYDLRSVRGYCEMAWKAAFERVQAAREPK